MKKLRRGNIHRTTFDQVYEGKIPLVGIYIIAYMGKIMYVGKAEETVIGRLASHTRYNLTPIGGWLNSMEFDWRNIRLDILEPPTHEDNREWLKRTENACIKRFAPLFNTQLMPEKPRFDAFGNDHYLEHSELYERNHPPPPLEATHESIQI